jgi:hypothetical protein
MKKFTILLSFVLLSGIAFAQIPNPGFENWSSPSGASYRNPTGWGTTNDVVVPSYNAPANVTKDTINKHSGLASAKLYSENYIVSFAGAMVTGTIAESDPEFTGGFPYNSRPGELTGYYEYTPAVGGDTLLMGVILFKWDTINKKRDTIALGTYISGDSVPAWQEFGLQLTYLSGANPDSAFILFFTSIGQFGLKNYGSTLWIDDVSFTGTAGTNDIKSSDVVNVFPNPAQSVIYINAVPGQFQTAIIYDITGRLVKTESVIGNEVDVNDLANGNYIMMLNDRHNNLSKAIVAITR